MKAVFALMFASAVLAMVLSWVSETSGRKRSSADQPVYPAHSSPADTAGNSGPL